MVENQNILEIFDTSLSRLHWVQFFIQIYMAFYILESEHKNQIWAINENRDKIPQHSKIKLKPTFVYVPPTLIIDFGDS